MLKRFLAVFALFLGLGFVSQAQEFTAVEFNTWVDGTGPTSPSFRFMNKSQSDSSDMVSLNDLFADDTLGAMVFYTTADTAQGACWVDYFAGTRYISSSPLDSLVYGFNTDKLSPVAAINVRTSLPPGATHVRGRVTQSATYNKDGDEGRLGIATVNKD